MALQAQKTKNDPADPVGQVLKLSFKAAFTELPEEARSREGGERKKKGTGMEFDVGSLYITSPSVHPSLFS